MNNDDYDINLVKNYLANHGYNFEDLNLMGQEEILGVYRRYNKKIVHQFQSSINGKEVVEKKIEEYGIEDELKEKLLEVGKSVTKLYDVIDKYIQHYHYEDFLKLLKLYLDDMPSSKIEKILEIKHHQFEEMYLSKIGDLLANLMPQERLVLMQFYEKKRDDLFELEEIYQKCRTQNVLEQMKEVASSKLEIIRNFMPDLMEENYKAYFDETPKKLEMVEKILELSKSYTRRYLKTLTISKLEFLENAIIEQNKKEILEKKLFKKHTKALEKTMVSLDDNEFSNACLNAISELNSEQLQKVIAHMASKYKTFSSKFNSATKSYKNMIKNYGN